MNDHEDDDFGGGPPTEGDTLAIDEYLNLPSFESVIAWITPVQNIEEAIELPVKVKRALQTRRFAIARTLTNAGLASLLKILARNCSVENWLNIHAFAGHQDAEPAATEFRQRCERGETSEREARQAEDAERVLQAKAIMGRRWRDGMVDAREWMGRVIGGSTDTFLKEDVLTGWLALTGARQFLETQEWQSPESFLVERLERSNRVIGRVDHAKDKTNLGEIGSASSDAKEAPEKTDTHLAKAREEINQIKAILDDREQVRRFVEGYAPGLKPPECIRQTLLDSYTRRWPQNRQLGERLKAMSVINWHEHWGKYGRQYKKLHELRSGSIHSATEAKRKSAKRTNALKAHDFCVAAVEEFLRESRGLDWRQELINFRFRKTPKSWKKSKQIVGAVLTVADYQLQIGRSVEGKKITERDIENFRDELPQRLTAFAPSLGYIDSDTERQQANLTAAECLARVDKFRQKNSKRK